MRNTFDGTEAGLVVSRIEASLTAVASALVLAVVSYASLALWWWLYEGAALAPIWSVAVVAGGGCVLLGLAAAVMSRMGLLTWPSAAWFLLPGPVAAAGVTFVLAASNSSERFFAQEFVSAALVMVSPMICALGVVAVTSNKRIERTPRALS